MNTQLLIPQPHAKDMLIKGEYQSLLKRFLNMSVPQENKQVFQFAYKLASKFALNENLYIKDMDECQVSISVKYDCDVEECKGYQAHHKNIETCIKEHDARLQFFVINLGKRKDLIINVGVEKLQCSKNEEVEIEPDSNFINIYTIRKHSWHHNMSHSKAISLSALPYSTDSLVDNGLELGLVFEIVAVGIKDQGFTSKRYDHKVCSGICKNLAQQLFSLANINPIQPKDQYGDVVLVIGENKIFCHKFVLEMSSSFFEKMFKADMKESKTNEVVLKEVDLSTIVALLHFMYTHDVTDDNITLKLLAVADMYQVKELRKICCQKLSSDLDAKNVAEIWEFSYMHNLKGLAHNCLLYMALNWKELIKEEDIKELSNKHPAMVFTISSLLSTSLSLVDNSISVKKLKKAIKDGVEGEKLRKRKRVDALMDQEIDEYSREYETAMNESFSLLYDDYYRNM